MTQSSLEDNQLETVIDNVKVVHVESLGINARIEGHPELQTIKIFVDEEAPLS